MELLIPTDKNGRGVNDPLAHFKSSDTKTDSDPQYFGFITMNGSWYILKMSDGGDTMRYAHGHSNYPTYWANRASIGYDYFHIQLPI